MRWLFITYRQFQSLSPALLFHAIYLAAVWKNLLLLFIQVFAVSFNFGLSKIHLKKETLHFTLIKRFSFRELFLVLEKNCNLVAVQPIIVSCLRWWQIKLNKTSTPEIEPAKFIHAESTQFWRSKYRMAYGLKKIYLLNKYLPWRRVALNAASVPPLNS